MLINVSRDKQCLHIKQTHITYLEESQKSLRAFSLTGHESFQKESVLTSHCRPNWGQSEGPRAGSRCLLSSQSTSIFAYLPAELLWGNWWPQAQRSKLNVNQEFQESIVYAVWHKIQRNSSSNLASHIAFTIFFSFLRSWKGAGNTNLKKYTHTYTHRWYL